MAAVRSTGSKAERLLRSALWRRGYRFRLHSKNLIGKPDIVLPRYHCVVFVDSDFWHARALVAEGEPALRAMVRGERQDWWVRKLSRNAERDMEVTRSLRQDGWRVLRVWESDILANVDVVAARLAGELRQRSVNQAERRGGARGKK